MSDVYIVKTRHQDIGYHSYLDFFRLAELSEFPVIYVDEIDPASDNTYILTPLNGEWTHGWQSPRARIIHYELEWRTDWRADIHEPPGVSEVWHMDAYAAHCIGAKYVPIGSHSGLKLDTPVDTHKVYDAALLSYMVTRRQLVAMELERYGLTLAPHDQLWGEARHRVLSQSRAVIHIHQHEHHKGIAALRWCLAAAYSLPVISETLADRGILRYDCTLQSDYQNLAQFSRNWLLRNGDNVLADYGRGLHGLLCKRSTFRKTIEAAL